MDAGILEPLLNTQKILMQKIINSPSNTHVFSNIEIDNLKIIIKEYLEQTPIDQNTLKLLIEKIEIGHLEKNEFNSTIQNIKIHYRFNNLLLESGSHI